MGHSPSSSAEAELLAKLLPGLRAAGGPRSLIVTVGTLFFGSTAVFSILHYGDNPWLFGGIILVSVLLVALLLAFGLGVLGRPVQAEPGPLSVFAIQKLGMFVGSGVPSPQALGEIVRAISGVQPLPLPAGIVEGEASREKDWKTVSASDAQRIAVEDNAAVERRLQEIALELAETAMRATLPWGPVKELQAQNKPEPEDTQDEEKSNQ